MPAKPNIISRGEWWTKAVAGQKGPVRPDQPEPGYYMTSLFRGGPKMPVRIWTEDGKPFCVVAGSFAPIGKHWPYVAMHPVTYQDYRARLTALGVVSDAVEGGARALTLDKAKPPF